MADRPYLFYELTNDRRYLRVEVRRDVRVLLVDGDPRTARRDDELFYLETALRPGDRDDSQLEVTTGSKDPAGHDLVVNATPLGMKDDDPLPMDIDRIDPGTFVGEVVMKQEITPLLRAARERGCGIQIGTDMLFEQIPLYLEFFGFGRTSDELRAVARLV